MNWISEIDDKLSPQERVILKMYRNPKSSDLRRQIRLSVQYAIGTGIFLVLCIWRDNPLYAILIYGVFVLWMVRRILGARKLTGIMPGILEKYESEIRELKNNMIVEPDMDILERQSD